MKRLLLAAAMTVAMAALLYFVILFIFGSVGLENATARILAMVIAVLSAGFADFWGMLGREPGVRGRLIGSLLSSGTVVLVILLTAWLGLFD